MELLAKLQSTDIENVSAIGIFFIDFLVLDSTKIKS